MKKGKVIPDPFLYIQNAYSRAYRNVAGPKKLKFSLIFRLSGVSMFFAFACAADTGDADTGAADTGAAARAAVPSVPFSPGLFISPLLSIHA